MLEIFLASQEIIILIPNLLRTIKNNISQKGYSEKKQLLALYAERNILMNFKKEKL